MVRDIGGYLELENYYGKEYHDKAIKLNSARNCLKYLIEAKNIRKIFIPKYECESIEKACKDMMCDFQFYNIDKELKPILECEVNDYVYVINYFGVLDNKYLKKLKDKYKNIIIDNVHAFFQKPIANTDTIYSCRKFFGVTDGAYLYTNSYIGKTLELDESTDRIKYLFGRYEKEAQTFYQEYKQNENIINDIPMRLMSLITENFMKSFNYDKIRQVRSDNFKYLNKILKDTNKFKLPDLKGAYMYPYYVNDGKMIKDRLISNNIYVPTLWPNVMANNDKDTLEYDLAKNVVFLPIDQRYNKVDMERIIQVIKSKE